MLHENSGWCRARPGRVFACKRLGTGNDYAVKVRSLKFVELSWALHNEVVNTKAISLRERTVASLRLVDCQLCFMTEILPTQEFRLCRLNRTVESSGVRSG